jgi:hypothetical protein
MTYSLSRLFFVSAFLCLCNQVNADLCGKIDAGPTYLHIDVLESGHTIKKIDMPAIKVDATQFIWNGVCLKPTILYAGRGNTKIMSGGCGIGHYTPIGDKCSITPSVGCNFTQFNTTLHNYPVMPDYFLDLKERFRSISPYVCIDASYCFVKGWRVIGSYQYVWSKTYTKIKGQHTTKSTPEGSNYGLMVERDLNDNWSVNLGAAYNSSLTKERHGLRGYGVRLGLAFWY